MLNINKTKNFRPPWIIAHRGYPYKYPENTLAAFQAAVRAGVAMIELDVMLSRDRKLVVIHDDTLERVMKLEFLVIDDFGQTRLTEWVVDTMFGLVCRRFDEGLVTLITTNLTHVDINEIDPRLGSRLHQALTVGTSSMPDHRKGKPHGPKAN